MLVVGSLMTDHIMTQDVILVLLTDSPPTLTLGSFLRDVNLCTSDESLSALLITLQPISLHLFNVGESSFPPSTGSFLRFFFFNF